MDTTLEDKSGLIKSDYTAATAHFLDDYLDSLKPIERVSNLLDIGCGLGGVTKATARRFNATAYGVDMDPGRVEVCRKRGIIADLVDINQDRLPYEDECFELVISNGVIEHLFYYDNLLSEAWRVLKPGGYLCINLPNLGSYIQRLSLLLGYQPSDVGISSAIFTGTIFYEGHGSHGHIHSATVRTMRKILEFYRFKVLSVKKASPPIGNEFSWLRIPIKIADFLAPVSLARRIIVLARKE